jgi:hypothetical protein
MTSPGYQNAYDAFDLLTIWRLTEQVVMVRGAISVYTLKELIIPTRRNFDIVLDLRAQGNADKVLEMIMNTMFILGLNQDTHLW